MAGFTLDDITITAPSEPVAGRAGKRQTKDGVQYLHQGIAQRGFDRRFELADHIEVTDASLANGLLSIELKQGSARGPEDRGPSRSPSARFSRRLSISRRL